MMWISVMLMALLQLQAQVSDTDAALIRLEAEWNTAHVQGDALAQNLAAQVPGLTDQFK